MNDTPEQHPPADENGDSGQSGSGAPHSQEIKHSQVSALVPERVARGVFSTGTVILQGVHEFILDFMIRMQQPQQVAARVILPHSVVPQFINALRENVDKYQNQYGEIRVPVRPGAKKPAEQPSPRDLYDQLKLHEDVMSGSYANAVMIGHTASEFAFDFITTFFPRSAVAARVYLSAPSVPPFLESLSASFAQFQKQRGGQRPSDPSDAQ